MHASTGRGEAVVLSFSRKTIKQKKSQANESLYNLTSWENALLLLHYVDPQSGLCSPGDGEVVISLHAPLPPPFLLRGAFGDLFSHLV